jgi:hypothetical protein
MSSVGRSSEGRWQRNKKRRQKGVVGQAIETKIEGNGNSEDQSGGGDGSQLQGEVILQQQGGIVFLGRKVKTQLLVLI